jgi:hypothetical protein
MKNNHKPLIATIIALLCYTVTDILIWQRIFETNQMIGYASSYHAGWLVSLFGYAMMGLLLMWGVWKDCFYFLFSLFISAFSGMEDVLYYVLDRKPMPHSLPWLDNNPMIFDISRNGVIGSALFWVGGLLLLYAVLYLRKKPVIALAPITEALPVPVPVSDPLHKDSIHLTSSI